MRLRQKPALPQLFDLCDEVLFHRLPGQVHQQLRLRPAYHNLPAVPAVHFREKARHRSDNSGQCSMFSGQQTHYPFVVVRSRARSTAECSPLSPGHAHSAPAPLRGAAWRITNTLVHECNIVTLCHPEGAFCAPEGSPRRKREILRTPKERRGAHIVPMSFGRMTRETATLRCNTNHPANIQRQGESLLYHPFSAGTIFSSAATNAGKSWFTTCQTRSSSTLI